MDRRMSIELDKYLTREPEWFETDDVVEDGNECPECGEARMDWLICQDDDSIKCTTCGHVYRLDEVEEG